MPTKTEKDQKLVNEDRILVAPLSASQIQQYRDSNLSPTFFADNAIICFFVRKKGTPPHPNDPELISRDFVWVPGGVVPHPEPNPPSIMFYYIHAEGNIPEMGNKNLLSEVRIECPNGHVWSVWGDKATLLHCEEQCHSFSIRKYQPEERKPSMRESLKNFYDTKVRRNEGMPVERRKQEMVTMVSCTRGL